MGAGAQGQTLGQAMSGPNSKAHSNSRTDRIESVPPIRKHLGSVESPSYQSGNRRAAYYQKQIAVDHVQPEQRSSSSADRIPKKKAMPSFLSSASAATTPAAIPAAASGWDAGGAETLPVEYGSAPARRSAIRDVSEPEQQSDGMHDTSRNNGQNRSMFGRRKDLDFLRIRSQKSSLEPPFELERTQSLAPQTSHTNAEPVSSEGSSQVSDKGTGPSTYRFLGDREATPPQRAEGLRQSAEPVPEQSEPVRASNLGSFGYYENVPIDPVSRNGQGQEPASFIASGEPEHDKRLNDQIERLQPAPAPSIQAKETVAPRDGSDFFGVGFESESIEEPEMALPSVGSTESVQPPQSQEKHATQGGRPYAHAEAFGSGYRTVAFDPSEYKEKSSKSDVDNAANWQHLRRKPSQTTAPQLQQHDPPPPPSTAARSSFIDDEDWVDRKFEEHQQTRPYAPPPPPVRNVNGRDNRPLTNSELPRSKLKCGRCGGRGHVARDCTNPSTARCHVCGVIGHMSRECPKQTPENRAQFRHLVDDPYEDERSPRLQQPRQRQRRDAARFDDPFSVPQSDQVLRPERRAHRGGESEKSNGPRRQRDFGDGSQRSNPFAASESGLRENDRGQRRADDRYDDRDGRAQDEFSSRGTPVQSQPDVEDVSRRQEARMSRRSQKWADADDHLESDRPSRFAKERKERRGGRRDFDEDNDEEVGAREEYRARKAARQAEENASRQAKEKAVRQRREAKKAAQTTPITLPEWTSVQQLSQLLGVRYEQFVERLEDLGYDDIFPGKTLNSEISGMIAMEYNFEPSFDFEGREEDERDLKAQPELADKDHLPVRPPVVTIMGHVDHGKTTILDYLRKSSVAAGEAGGITQHIGAFSVPLASSGKTVTFLDTPGHAAFLAMRQRGANVTDIVILVVAADDSVKPQTLEALKHAKAAGVAMIVAINKVDKEGADIQRCKQDLARHGVEIEDFGGETQVVCVSGKTGQGMDELEENVVTLSEILDHRADTDGVVEGWVLEATTKKAGRVATVLVRRGTLRPGCVLVAGKTWTRVRSLRNEGGIAVPEVGPGMPVEVDGWRDQPMAGDEVLQAESEQQATSVVDFRLEKEEREKIAQDTEAINENRRLEQERKEKERAVEAAAKRAASVSREDEAVSAAVAEDNAQEQQSGQMMVPFIIKADVSGSAEAVSAYIMSVSNPLITPQILSSGVGAIHESDIDLAHAASGHIIAFNLPADPDMKALAEYRDVKILENNIIYRVLDDVKAVSTLR